MDSGILLFFQYLILISLLVIVIAIYRVNRIIILEKRFLKYSIQPRIDDALSFFDTIDSIYFKFIAKISNILKKSVFITRYSARYEKYIDYTRDDAKKTTDLIAIKVFYSIIALLILALYYVLTASYITMGHVFIAFILGFFGPNIYYYYISKKNKKSVETDLLKAIIIINNAFKSGRTIMQAIEIVKNELHGPIADEFKKIYLDLSYGLSIDIVFNRFSKRVNSKEASYIASSITILNKTGGNIVKVFNSIEKSFFNQKKLRNELKSLTAAANIIVKVLMVIPFLFFIAIYILNPTYFAPLFRSSVGIMIVVIMVLIYMLYIFIVRKMMNVRM